MTDKRRPRIALYLDPEQLEAAERLAALRYGDNTSAALRACISVGLEVLGDRRTLGVLEPLEALQLYCSGRPDGGG